MSTWSIIVLLIAVFSLAGGVILSVLWRRAEAHLRTRESEREARLYEIAILKELGERIGYSLNIRKIVEVITGSLAQFIDYTAVSSLLIEQRAAFFHCHLEASVGASFVDTVKARMRAALEALTSEPLGQYRWEETLTGAMLLESVAAPVRSFFNIPLVIRDRTVGVLTVASTKPGLYKEDEMTILYKLTAQASQAVSKLEEVLAIEEEKVNAMVESMPDGLVMVDQEYRIVVANPALRAALGIPGDKEVTIFSLIEGVGAALDIRGKLEESLQLTRLIVADTVVLKGNTYQVLISPVLRRGGQGMAADKFGAVALFHDITKEKAAERMREDFTSMMVHELRSPLDGIRKLTEILQTAKRRNAKTQAEFIRMIHNSSAEMLELVSSLLDVAKIEAGKFQILPVPGDIGAVVADKVSYFTPQLQERSVALSAHLDAALPQLSFDPHRIAQVLNNLLSNAAKFTSSGGTIRVTAFRHAAAGDLNREGAAADPQWHAVDAARIPALELAAVAVSDTGVGIPRDELPHLFTKFRQLSAGTMAQKGTGLGLVISRGIVAAHGGQLLVGSEEGKGTTFVFLLPLTLARAGIGS